MIKNNSLINALMPNYCALCNKVSTQTYCLCASCEACLPWIKDSGQSLSGRSSNYSALPFNRLVIPFEYKTPISWMLTRLKFSKVLAYSEILANLLYKKVLEVYRNLENLPNFIIPMPLHPTRLKARGFNQALEIAKPIAKLLNLTVDKQSCIRIKSTQPQTLIPAKQRYENVKDAFVARPLSSESVIIIDDIITTGNTLSQLCATLTKAGIKKIDVWCCAQSIHQ